MVAISEGNVGSLMSHCSGVSAAGDDPWVLVRICNLF